MAKRSAWRGAEVSVQLLLRNDTLGPKAGFVVRFQRSQPGTTACGVRTVRLNWFLTVRQFMEIKAEEF